MSLSLPLEIVGINDVLGEFEEYAAKLSKSGLDKATTTNAVKDSMARK